MPRIGKRTGRNKVYLKYRKVEIQFIQTSFNTLYNKKILGLVTEDF